MTPRAVLLGLAGAAAVCAFGFFNDMVIRGTFLIGNYMPISVYGLLILFLLAVNPLLARARKRLALTGRELAVILALVLPACYVPGRSLMHLFTNVLMLPHHYERNRPGWQRQGVVKMVPDVMLASVSPRLREEDVLDPVGLCVRLVDEGKGPSSGPGRAIWTYMAPEDREAIAAALSAPAVGARDQRGGPAPAVGAHDQRGGPAPAVGAHDRRGGPAPAPEQVCRKTVVRALNRALERRDLYNAHAFSDVILPAEATQLLEIGVESLTDEKVRTLNRHLIDAAYPKQMRSLESRKSYAVDGFVQGIGVGTKGISFRQVPWYAWTGTLLRFWLPLILAFSVAVIGLALVVHRQWSDHEHLPYPIVTFAHSLLPAEGESKGVIFKKGAFWVAAGTIMFIHLNNYAYQWWPERLVEIPRYFDFRSLSGLVPTLQRGGLGRVMNPTIFFTAIGFAYFVASDVSLSLGLAPFAYAWAAGLFAGYGVSFGGSQISTSIRGALFAGAYFGIFLFLIYTGRRYYATVFRRSLWLRAKDEVEPSAIWGARVFMAGATLFILRLAVAGLGWHWAVLYTMAAAMLFLVMSRIVAETGMFFIDAYWTPGVLLWGFVGAKALGPQAMLFMFLVTCVLMIDPRTALMPFVVHSLKLAETGGARAGRAALWGGCALVLGLVIALPIVLHIQYDHGAPAVSDGRTLSVPRFPFDAVMVAKQRLGGQGPVSGAAWLRSISPAAKPVIAFFVALGLVLLCTAARLRFPRWPLHPVLFAALGSYQSRCLAVSFLIGWLIKAVVTKYGGAGVYRRLKPVMIGIIAGDMLGGVIPMAIGAVYYFATGRPPRFYSVLPR